MNHTLTITCNPRKCVECHTCEVSCRAVNHLESGIKWRWVEWTWQGSYPDVTVTSISRGCLHCADAPCIGACSSNAIHKDPETGIVLVDREKCAGSRNCLEACPYDVPRFGKNGKMQKCNLCFDRVKAGKLPVCVETCPAGALELISVANES